MNEIKEKLKVFQDFKFFSEDHHYEFKGELVGISVTRFIEQYCNEFERDLIAERCAIKNQQIVDRISKDRWQTAEDFELLNKILTDKTNTSQGILELWEYKNKFACEKGSTCHEFAQSRWSKEKYELNKFDESDEYLEAVLKIQKQAVNFYNDYKDTLEHLADEFVVGSEEYDIASAIDHLFINKLTGGLVLVDYKTNSILKGYNDDEKNRKYAKNMKVPLQHIKDLTLNHYYIQLSIYRYLLEKYANVEVEEMFIVYFSENIENYEIIEIPYMKKEVEEILENRRVKNMNSVPVLLIGRSGTGKSTSLRNFENEDVAIINVLGKQLPFKNKLKNIITTDDYNTILKNIEATKRKTIIIDDAGYLITNQFMKNHSKGGTGNAVFAVYNELADKFWNLVNQIKTIKGGKTVYFIMHEDTDDFGKIRPKTIGKLLDDKVCIEGMFTIAIRSIFKEGKYIFRTKTDGNDIVKTPIDMFENAEYDNDLKEIDKVIREYYELDKEENKESEEK